MSINNTILSTQFHIGNQKFISVDATYDNNMITELVYNVYKQYGYSKFPIGNAIVKDNSIRSTMDSNFGINSNKMKQKVFKRFFANMSDEMYVQIEKIIKGVK